MSHVTIILLAAGKSRRFREACGRHKLLEALPGSALTVFETSLKNAQLTGLPVTVVLRPEDQELRRFCQLMGASFVTLDSQGMGDSVAAGVRATPDSAGWIVALGDMPFISPALFSRVHQAVKAGSTARPIYRNTGGHPVGFPAVVGPRLASLSGEEGARAIFAEHPPQLIEADDGSCLWDIDLPQQLVADIQHSNRFK